MLLIIFINGHLKWIGRIARVPLQPALPWRRLDRDLSHRASSTEPQPIYSEASEKRNRLHNHNFLFTTKLGGPQRKIVIWLDI